MNIEERLEALTQTAELLAGMRRHSEKKLDQLTQNVEGMRGFIDPVAQGTARLLNIAELPERRLDNHNHRIEKLES
jgi:phage shock protein A